MMPIREKIKYKGRIESVKEFSEIRMSYLLPFVTKTIPEYLSLEIGGEVTGSLTGADGRKVDINERERAVELIRKDLIARECRYSIPEEQLFGLLSINPDGKVHIPIHTGSDAYDDLFEDWVTGMDMSIEGKREVECGYSRKLVNCFSKALDFLVVSEGKIAVNGKDKYSFTTDDFSTEIEKIEET
jgi:hypothetical protein